MFNAIFYTFSKKPNSTLRPSSGGTTYSIRLVDNCSIINPIIRLRGSSASDMLGRFNYCYISEFNRYYFVVDSGYDADRGIWEMSLRCDVLATARDEIKASTQFVERSFSRWDFLIDDTVYPSKAQAQFSNTVYSQFFDATPVTGQYIIGMVSKGSSYSRFGGVQYYLLTYTHMNALIDYMMNIINYADSTITGIATELLGLISDPMSYIVSCKFFPKTLIDMTQLTPQVINFGAFESTVYGAPLPGSFIDPSPVIHRGFTMPLTDHPQKATRGSWLNGNGHTERTLRFEPFGVIPLDSSKLIGYGYIYLDVAIDIITGQGVLSIYACEDSSSIPSNLDTMPLLGTYPSQVLIDIPLTQNRHEAFGSFAIDNIVKPLLNTADQVGQKVSGFDFYGAISSLGSGMHQGMFTIGDGLKNFYNPPAARGTPGSLLCRMNVVICNKFMILVDEDQAEFGRPLCSYTTLTNLSGFCKCLNANISTTLTALENEQIENFLNSGFFIDT